MFFLFRNAVLFNIYQFASISLLSMMDPLTHSILNTLKRFTGIVVVTVMLQDVITSKHVLGFIIALAGFVGYTLSSELGGCGSSISSKTRRKASVLSQLVIFPIIIFTVSPSLTMLENRSIISNMLLPNASAHSTLDFRSPSQGKPHSFNTSEPANLLLDYYSPFNFTVSSYRDADLVPGNLGDLVWRFSSTRAVPDFSNSTVFKCHAKTDCFKWFDKRREGRKIVAHLPCANQLSAHQVRRMDVVRWYASDSRVRRVIVNGIGAQMDYQHPISSIQSLNMSWEVASAGYDISSEMMSILKSMDSLPVDLLVRGKFTESIARRAGFSRVRSVGCPSLFLNKDSKLGLSLHQKYSELKKRVGDRSLRVAVTLSSFRNDFRVFPRIAKEYPNSLFYAQTTYDLKMMEQFGVPFNRTRVFTNLEDWVESLKGMDMAFGSRIHGSMAAVAAGVPILVIAIDYRVLELVQQMRLPFLTQYEDSILGGRFDLAELASSSSFKGTDFDKNRCETARFVAKVYHDSGSKVQPHILRLAQDCEQSNTWN